MVTISRCPCCGGHDFRAWPALVAPFVADYVLGTAPAPVCRFLECRACSFRFFDARYTDDEMRRLYGNYRGPDYFRARHRHEPWYTARFNDRIGEGPIVDARRARLSRFLARHLTRDAVGTIVDYGGDSGQLLPEGWGTERWVVDLSDAEPVAGVRKATSVAAIGASADLVVAAHVLEHAPDPSATLVELTSLARPTGHVYVEVPFERFSMHGVGRGAVSRAWLAVLRRAPLALRAVDFLSAAARVRLGFVPPFGIVRCHEHVNFFDEQSLRALAARGGLRVVAIERGPVAPGVDRTEVLAALLAVAG